MTTAQDGGKVVSLTHRPVRIQINVLGYAQEALDFHHHTTMGVLADSFVSVTGLRIEIFQ